MAAAKLSVIVEAQVAKFQQQFVEATKTAQKFEKDFANVASSLSAQQKRINDAFSSFSGDRIARDAAAVAKAVEQIGGASKLTASEQARVNALMTEAVEKYKALGQTAPKAMTDLAAATKKVRDEVAVVGKTENFFGSLATQIQATAAGFISAQAIIGGVQAAFRGLTTFVAGSVKAFAESEKASKQLAVALQNQGPAAIAARDGYDQLAAQFQRMTVFEDDLITQSQALLVEIGNVMPSQMEGALRAATDLASGLGIDLLDAVKLVGKSFAGETGSLKRYGIVIDEAMLKTQGADAVLGAIQKRFGGQAQAELDTYAGKVQQLANAWDDLQEQVGEYIVNDPILKAALTTANKLLTDQTKAVDENNSSWSLSTVFMPQIVETWRRAHEQAVPLANAINTMADAATLMSRVPPPASNWGPALQNQFTPSIIDATQYLKDFEKAQNESRQASEAHAKAIAELGKQLSGQGALKSAQDMIEAIRGLKDINGRALPVWRLTREEQDRVNRVMEDAIAVYRKQGIEAPEAIRKIAAATFDLAKLTPAIIEGLPKALEAIGKQAQIAGVEIQTMLAAMEAAAVVNSKMKIGLDSAPGFSLDPKVLGGDFGKKEAKTAGEQFGRELSQAIIGAIQGGGDIGKTIGAVMGKNVGESLGKSLAGAVGGKFGAALGGMLGPLGAIGGQLLGGLVDKIFGKSKERKAVESFADSFGGFDKLQKQLQTLPKHADTLWKALTQGGAKSKDAIDAITEAFRLQEEAMNQTLPSYAEASAAAEKLGLDVSKIGGLDVLRITDESKDLAAQWEILAKAGADMEQVAIGAAEKFQVMVDEALKWGHTLPESMRSPLQKMVDMGLVTNAAGERLEDLSGIKFEKPLQAAIDSLIVKLDELIEKITGGLGGALRGLPSSIEMDVPAFGSGGIVHRPTLAMVGESGPEAIIPLSSGGFTSESPPIVVKTYLDGYQIAEATVPHIPAVVNRRA